MDNKHTLDVFTGDQCQRISSEIEPILLLEFETHKEQWSIGRVFYKRYRLHSIWCIMWHGRIRIIHMVITATGENDDCADMTINSWDEITTLPEALEVTNA